MRRRFIAGAVCPECGQMDRLVLKQDGKERHCVACGHRDALPVTTSPAPKTRLDGGLENLETGLDDPEGTRPVRILNADSKDAR